MQFRSGWLWLPLALAVNMWEVFNEIIGRRNHLNRNPFQLDAKPVHGHPESRTNFNKRLSYFGVEGGRLFGEIYSKTKAFYYI